MNPKLGTGNEEAYPVWEGGDFVPLDCNDNAEKQILWTSS